jgi:hypothetical protein
VAIERRKFWEFGKQGKMLIFTRYRKPLSKPLSCEERGFEFGDLEEKGDG